MKKIMLAMLAMAILEGSFAQNKKAVKFTPPVVKKNRSAKRTHKVPHPPTILEVETSDLPIPPPPPPPPPRIKHKN